MHALNSNTSMFYCTHTSESGRALWEHAGAIGEHMATYDCSRSGSKSMQRPNTPLLLAYLVKKREEERRSLVE